MAYYTSLGSQIALWSCVFESSTSSYVSSGNISPTNMQTLYTAVKGSDMKNRHEFIIEYNNKYQNTYDCYILSDAVRSTNSTNYTYLSLTCDEPQYGDNAPRYGDYDNAINSSYSKNLTIGGANSNYYYLIVCLDLNHNVGAHGVNEELSDFGLQIGGSGWENINSDYNSSENLNYGGANTYSFVNLNTSLSQFTSWNSSGEQITVNTTDGVPYLKYEGSGVYSQSSIHKYIIHLYKILYNPYIFPNTINGTNSNTTQLTIRGSVAGSTSSSGYGSLLHKMFCGGNYYSEETLSVDWNNSSSPGQYVNMKLHLKEFAYYDNSGNINISSSVNRNYICFGLNFLCDNYKYKLRQSLLLKSLSDTSNPSLAQDFKYLGAGKQIISSRSGSTGQTVTQSLYFLSNTSYDRNTSKIGLQFVIHNLISTNSNNEYAKIDDSDNTLNYSLSITPTNSCAFPLYRDQSGNIIVCTDFLGHLKELDDESITANNTSCTGSISTGGYVEGLAAKTATINLNLNFNLSSNALVYTDSLVPTGIWFEVKYIVKPKDVSTPSINKFKQTYIYRIFVLYTDSSKSIDDASKLYTLAHVIGNSRSSEALGGYGPSLMYDHDTSVIVSPKILANYTEIDLEQGDDADYHGEAGYVLFNATNNSIVGSLKMYDDNTISASDLTPSTLFPSEGESACINKKYLIGAWRTYTDTASDPAFSTLSPITYNSNYASIDTVISTHSVDVN